MNDFFDTLKDILEDEERDFRYKLGDKLVNLHSDLGFIPIISYEYLNIDILSEFSFIQPEFHSITSEQYPNKSDYNIYFETIKQICSKKIDVLRGESYTKHFNLFTNPQKELTEIVRKIMNIKNPKTQLPQLGEFGLYTNKNGNKAPRIFFFVGNLGILYILFYDPFHKIFPRKS